MITTVADTAPERLLAPVAIARILQVSPSAPLRWLTRGVLLSDGSRLKLKSIRLPGSYRVKPEWLDAFLGRLADDRAGKPDDAIEAAEPAHSLHVARTTTELSEAGLLPSSA
jgi:hypothetical protein